MKLRFVNRVVRSISLFTPNACWTFLVFFVRTNDESRCNEQSRIAICFDSVESRLLGLCTGYLSGSFNRRLRSLMNFSAFLVRPIMKVGLGSLKMLCSRAHFSSDNFCGACINRFSKSSRETPCSVSIFYRHVA